MSALNYYTHCEKFIDTNNIFHRYKGNYGNYLKTHFVNYY